jgi:large subunit ribosomal protein L30
MMMSTQSKKGHKTEKNNQKKETVSEKGAGMLVAVRIRGNLRQTEKEAFALRLLKLLRVHSCSVMDDTPSMRGLLAQTSHVVAWGELDHPFEETLKKKYRSQRPGKMHAGSIRWLTLHPPRGGYERKGRKLPYTQGGAAGYRGREINDLIKRMI